MRSYPCACRSMLRAPGPPRGSPAGWGTVAVGWGFLRTCMRFFSYEFMCVVVTVALALLVFVSVCFFLGRWPSPKHEHNSSSHYHNSDRHHHHDPRKLVSTIVTPRADVGCRDHAPLHTLRLHRTLHHEGVRQWGRAAAGRTRQSRYLPLQVAMVVVMVAVAAAVVVALR